MKRWGEAQAGFYVRRIGRGVEAVPAQPSLGRPCPAVGTGYRKHPTGSRVLFYRLTRNGIDVVRILHERMDFTRHP